MPIRCQEVVVVKLIGASKGRWAGIADNVCFPSELKSGKNQQEMWPQSLGSHRGPALYIYMHESNLNVVNDTVNVFQHEHDLNMNVA